jgi:hypothetical protein
LTSYNSLAELKIEPEGSEVRRVIIWFNLNSRWLTGIELFDENDMRILEAGYDNRIRYDHDDDIHEI